MTYDFKVVSSCLPILGVPAVHVCDILDTADIYWRREREIGIDHVSHFVEQSALSSAFNRTLGDCLL